MIVFIILFDFILTILLNYLLVAFLASFLMGPFVLYRFTGIVGNYFFIYFFFFFLLLLFLLQFVSYYKIWRKMGKPAWRYFLPLITDIEMLNTLGGDRGILFLCPILFGFILLVDDGIRFDGVKGDMAIFLSFVSVFYLLFKLEKIRWLLARAFGKGGGFWLGLFFLPFIFVPMLAFGKAKWIGRKEEKDKVEEENHEKG